MDFESLGEFVDGYCVFFCEDVFGFDYCYVEGVQCFLDVGVFFCEVCVQKIDLFCGVFD